LALFDDDAVAERLERPAKRNAIDRVSTQELDHALNDFQDDPR
jgi:enoyl-CoA hydratase/carnithine racemase